jgi:hypothetical protein
MLNYFFKIAPSYVKNLKILDCLLPDYGLADTAGLLCDFTISITQEVL